MRAKLEDVQPMVINRTKLANTSDCLTIYPPPRALAGQTSSRCRNHPPTTKGAGRSRRPNAFIVHNFGQALPSMESKAALASCWGITTDHQCDLSVTLQCKKARGRKLCWNSPSEFELRWLGRLGDPSGTACKKGKPGFVPKAGLLQFPARAKRRGRSRRHNHSLGCDVGGGFTEVTTCGGSGVTLRSFVRAPAASVSAWSALIACFRFSAGSSFSKPLLASLNEVLPSKFLVHPDDTKPTATKKMSPRQKETPRALGGGASCVTRPAKGSPWGWGVGVGAY